MNQELCYENKNNFSTLSDTEKEAVFAFSEQYRQFISKAKTERECCDEAVAMLLSAGFLPLEKVNELKAGDKVFAINRGKGVVAAVIGTEDIQKGIRLVGAHMDAPRLDLKPIPLYEDNGFAFFKTHYYGGIKKYQWTTIPLAIHGVITLQDGTNINVVIGEEETDPVFCVTDLLPHLGAEQMSKKAKEFIPGERLNVLLGNLPIEDEDAKDKIKCNILKLLHDKYGICEEDFISSEIEIVPAYGARDVGLDRSMIGGYAQDDRVCSYGALRGLLDLTSPIHTAVCLLVDKEEIGSMGVTGMRSQFFENTLAKMCAKMVPQYSDLVLRECLSNSKCLSADVGAAYDPNYPEPCEKNNSAFLNCGILLSKYTGSGGKGGASDASAEFVAYVRRIFNEKGVHWQMAELGKVDAGGGGTISQYIANMDVDVLDAGTPLLSMHAPFEIAGKLDIYMTYKGYREFYIYD